MKSSNVQIQQQDQLLLQQQRLSQIQLIQVRLLELPLAELEQRIQDELSDNPALEQDYNDDVDDDDNVNDEVVDEREEQINEALEEMSRDDEMVTPTTYSTNSADYEEMVYGNTESFYDQLKEQLNELDIDDRKQQIIEYIIGSIDSDGLLRKDLITISDELAIYQNIDASEDEIEDMLLLIQKFDPAGIGARSLQECLLLQIERMPKSSMRDFMEIVISDHFDDFTHKRWEKIKSALSLSGADSESLRKELTRLNPKPGAALGETIGRSIDSITPDYIVDTTPDGQISFYVNHGDMPALTVSDSFTDMINELEENEDSLNKSSEEALFYARDKVEKAQWFIDALKKRFKTMYSTMAAIIEIQRQFFLEGDESDLRPMILKDIAERTSLDISTISRACNDRYVLTQWGTFPLRFFFSEAYTTNEGEEMSVRKIKAVLNELIEKEDKNHPLSDEKLTAEINKLGYPIARRTVAKYREQLGIPVARMRK